MNQPSRAEKFVLPDGVRKLTFTRDTKVANAGTFIVQKEDHTLGNTVRMQLHRDPNVVFAGYQVPPTLPTTASSSRCARAPRARRVVAVRPSPFTAHLGFIFAPRELTPARKPPLTRANIRKTHRCTRPKTRPPCRR